MEFFIENNSEEDITVTSRTASVNNAVFGTAMFIAEINAGQNSTNHIYIHDDDCKAYGITEIGVVEFSINIAKISYTNLYLYKDDLAAKNINSVEKVEFSIKVMNAETINDIDKSEILTIDLK